MSAADLQNERGFMVYPSGGWRKAMFKAPLYLWRMGLGMLLPPANPGAGNHRAQEWPAPAHDGRVLEDRWHDVYRQRLGKAPAVGEKHRGRPDGNGGISQ